MQIILPNRSRGQLSQTIQTLGSGVDRFLGAGRLKKAEKRQGVLDAQQLITDAEEKKLRDLKTDVTQQKVDAGKIKAGSLADQAGILKEIGDLESGDLEKGIRKTELGSTEFAGPLQNQPTQDTQDRLIAKYARSKGDAQTVEGVKLDRRLKELPLAEKGLAGPDGTLPADKVVKIEREMRNDFLRQSGEFVKQRDAYGRIIKSGESPSPAGDMALIFNYMKLLDPGSVVRESEFRTAADAKAWLTKTDGADGVTIPSFVKATILKAKEGTLLLPDQRKDFIGRSQKLFSGANAQHTKRSDTFRQLAENKRSIGIDPENVVIDIGLAIQAGLIPKDEPAKAKTAESGTDTGLPGAKGQIFNSAIEAAVEAKKQGLPPGTIMKIKKPNGEIEEVEL